MLTLKLGYPVLASSRSTCVLLASSSVAVMAWRVLQWRARQRARIVASRAQSMVNDGPMVDCSSAKNRLRILNTAICRASKWMSYLRTDEAKPMRGQVGGVSFNKRPVLTIKPDYVLKPLHTDHRGFREIAFYEALKVACRGKGSKNASIAALTMGTENSDESSGHHPSKSARSAANGYNAAGLVALENCDALAMWLAVFTQDAIVAESEDALVKCWRLLNKEIESLRRLSTFTAEYYGVLGQDIVSQPVVNFGGSHSEISSNAYLLLSDATHSFSKPCAIDIKMGRQSFEPDAAIDKQERERRKYARQADFGFRIVGMRVYEPSHPESDKLGFRKFDKSFGRSLESREAVINALRTFFRNSAAGRDKGCDNQYNSSRESISRKKTNAIEAFSGKDLIRSRPMMKLMAELRCVKRWFEENTSLAFYSSSILMVYEGDLNVGSSREMSNIKMIDFGHVRRQSGGDPSYLYGIRVLLSMMSEILEDTAKR